ncbi:hypothetical protein Tco_0592966 [Tanacetum coccineum]
MRRIEEDARRLANICKVPIKVQVQLRPISMATAAACTTTIKVLIKGIPLSVVKGIARQIRIKVNIEKALDSLLKGSERGSMMAMMDAWLVYWDIRKKEEGVRMEACMFFWLPVADLQSAIDGVL